MTARCRRMSKRWRETGGSSTYSCSPRRWRNTSTGASSRWRDATRVLDMCDVDSDKWRQYALRHRWPMSWVYRSRGRAARQDRARMRARLRRDAARVQQRSGLPAQGGAGSGPQGPRHAQRRRRRVLRSGASQRDRRSRPITKRSRSPARWTTGPTSMRSNWFAREVLPLIVRRRPGVRFYIVGSNPTDAVRRLAELPAVVGDRLGAGHSSLPATRACSRRAAAGRSRHSEQGPGSARDGASARRDQGGAGGAGSSARAVGRAGKRTG